MEVLAVNAGGKINSSLAFESLLNVVSEIAPSWGFLFVSEFDFCSDPSFDLSVLSHKVWRHYPGLGSRAMAWVARNTVTHLVRSCNWDGRAGSLLVSHSHALAGQAVNLLLVGVHAAHDVLLADSLSSTSSLLSQRPRHSDIVAVGDWNVDFLPTLASDPFSESPNRSLHHSDRRDTIEA